MKKIFGLGLFILVVIGLMGCSNNGSQKKPSSNGESKAFIQINNTRIPIEEDGSIKFDFKTNKNAKYALYDTDNNSKLLTSGTTKSGRMTITGSSNPGNVLLKVTYKGSSATKKLVMISSSTSTKKSSSQAESNSRKVYALNEEAIGATSSNAKMFGLKLTGATKSFDAHGQGLVNSEPAFLAISNEKSVQFTFDYTNYGMSAGFLPRLQYFTAYGPDNKAAEIVSQQEGQDEVSQNRTGTTTFWANFNQDTPAGTKVQIEFKNSDMASPFVFETTVN